MTDFIDIRTATAQKEDAYKIADALVAQKLAASAQVSGPIRSIYWWKGEIVTSEEWIITAKTRQDLYQKIEQAIRSMHPYKEPGIIAFPILTGSSSYFKWISQETTSRESQMIKENTKTAKEQQIQAFDEAYKKLIKAAKSAVERGTNTQTNEWEPREVLAHIAGWAAQATAIIPHIIAGLPTIQYDSNTQHAIVDDAANAAFIALLGNQTFEQVINIADQTHQRFVQMLKEQDDNIFVPSSYVYERMQRVIDHHLEHAKELEEQ